MKIYRGITEVLDLNFEPEGTERKELMVEHSISFSFERTTYVSLEKGDSITYNGKKFYLKDDYVPEINKQTNGFVYDLKFYDIMERMKDIKLKYNGETDFKLTTTGSQFLDVVVSSFSGLTKGSFPTDIKEIHFENVSVFDALNLITEIYDTEWWLNGSTLNLSKCEFGAPVILRLDTELDEISVSPSSETLVTRLYAKGSTRNIPNGYSKDNRLKLASGYVDLIPDLPESKIIEGVHIFEDIYPRQTTSIVEVIQGSAGDTPIFTIRGNNTFEITQNDVIAGQPLKIAFNTGNLAGREFELIIRGDNKFEIKYIQEGDLVIPNLTLKPEVGDEFFFFNFNAESVLPTLIAQAENELLVAAQDYLDNLGSQLVYDCETRSIYCEQNVIDLAIGQVVTIQSENIGSVTTRIRAYEKQLLNSFECKYQAGDYSKYSRLKEIANRIKDSTPELQTLKSTLEYVFQDGIVTESELKSIEAILTNLSVERGQLNAQYLVVRGNVNLINKTPLETAWSNYQTAFVDVETAINNAITDKLISDAEKANIDNKISIYSTRTNEFATALENAREAIENYKNQGLLDVVEQNKQYLQQQIDGEISNYYQPYKPTLANYPASEWTTNLEKDRHIGDLFLNIQAYVDDITTPDAGKAWRFIKDGTTYLWTPIADSDTVKAMKLAAQAQSTADGKSTTFLITPSNYKLGDMWVLNADQTVNGTAYKSGEILTATQDSATYNQAHWIKRVRYTDDTAVNELEIGGRNLIIGSFNDWKSRTIGQYGATFGYIPINDDWRGKTVTHSFEVKDIPEGESVRIRIDFNRPDGTYITPYHGKIVNLAGKSFVNYIVPTDTQYNRIRARIMPVNYTSDYNVLFRCEKLEFGNKPTDWTESQEDVQARIDAAKTEAENAAQAYADTKSEAERVLAEAYADGKVSAEEQARIDDVNAKLAAAKAYAEAQDALLKTQQEAYADGVANEAELAAIAVAEAKANLARTEAEAYADGKVSAEEARAIADANAKLAAAQNYADNLPYVRRNLAQRKDILAWKDLGSINLTEGTDSVEGNYYRYTFGALNGKELFPSIKFKENTRYTLSVKTVLESGNAPYFTFYYTDGTEDLYVFKYADASPTAKAYTTRNNKTLASIKHTHGSNGYVKLFWVNIVEGTKAVLERNEAPEDARDVAETAKIQAERAQLQADGYMRARYVRDWSQGYSTNANANHWKEVQVFNKAGVNLAKNKIPTTNGTPHASYPLTNATDEDINTTAINGYGASVGASLDYLRIDLGQVYYDIDYIKIVHGIDGRITYNTKTEISEDGVNWTTIFDSAIEGTYKETAEGKIHSQRWAKVISKLNQSKAITDKFKTTINGGLITTVMMLLREVNSQINTAGFSGIQEDGYSPAYWSGGTYEQALAFSELMRAVDRGDNPIAFAILNAEMSSIALLHNGHAKLGELIVKSNGQIVILDKIAGKIKFVINSQNIPSIADLMDDAVFGETEDNTAVGGITDTITLTKKISVTKDNSTINFGGTISVSVRNNTNFASATMTAELHKEGNYYARLGSISATKNGITLEPASASSVINKTLTGVGRGQYSVKLIVNATGDVRDYVGSISASTLEWSFLQSGVRYFQLGLNGLMAFYSNNHFHFTEDGGLDVRGSVNMPGVLLSATVLIAGGWMAVWGAKASLVSPVTPTPVRNSTGRYTVSHDVGHTNYQIYASSHTANTTFHIVSKSANSFTIEWRTVASSPVLVNTTFDFQLVGNNYA